MKQHTPHHELISPVKCVHIMKLLKKPHTAAILVTFTANPNQQPHPPGIFYTIFLPA